MSAFQNSNMVKHDKKGIDKFVLKQCQLLQNEEEAHTFKVSNTPSFRAKGSHLKKSSLNSANAYKGGGSRPCPNFMEYFRL